MKQTTYQRFFLLGRMTLTFTGLALVVYLVLLGIGNFGEGKHAFNLFFSAVFLINFVLCISYFILAKTKFKDLVNTNEKITTNVLMIINILTTGFSIWYIVTKL